MVLEVEVKNVILQVIKLTMSVYEDKRLYPSVR